MSAISNNSTPRVGNEQTFFLSDMHPRTEADVSSTCECNANARNASFAKPAVAYQHILADKKIEQTSTPALKFRLMVLFSYFFCFFFRIFCGFR